MEQWRRCGSSYFCWYWFSVACPRVFEMMKPTLLSWIYTGDQVKKHPKPKHNKKSIQTNRYPSYKPPSPNSFPPTAPGECQNRFWKVHFALYRGSKFEPGSRIVFLRPAECGRNAIFWSSPDVHQIGGINEPIRTVALATICEGFVQICPHSKPSLGLKIIKSVY